MPIITAKYAPPSIMACANASLTVESQHVSVGSNSFAALSHSEINLPPSRHLSAHAQHRKERIYKY